MRHRWVVACTLGLIAMCCVVGSYLKTPEPSKQKFVRDEYGRIMIYHGVNVSNFSKHSGPIPEGLTRGSADTCWQSREDFQKLPGWGANLVRHIWQWASLEPQKDQWDQAYKNRKVERILWMGTYGTHVIVDLHQDLFMQKTCGNGFPEWAEMPDAGTFGGCRDPWNLGYLDTVVLKNYDHFWNSPELQDQYVELIDFVFSIVENIPNVIGVDVMNEPFPDMSGKFERVKLTRLYERIKDMIEEKGYTKLMFFEPWMSTSAGPSTCLKFGAGEGTVYFPHYYDVFVDANKPYGPANKKLMEQVIQAKVYEAEQFECPIMFGEFGARPAGPGALEYIADLLDLFDKYRIGWTYYSYDMPQHCGYAFIDQNKNPNAMHEVLFGRVYPQRIAGDDPTYAIVGNQFTLTYTKRDIQQPTVIFIPANKQVTVETQGQYTISGQWLMYTNTDEQTQSVTVKW